MNLAMAWRRSVGLLLAVWVCGCGDDSPGAGTESGTEGTTEEPETTSTSDPTTTSSSMSNTSVSSTTEDPTTSSTTEEASTGVPECMPEFEMLPGDALPRCEAATLDCWNGCPGVDPHECTSACTAADSTPTYMLPDGSTVDCGRCINRLFGICWHEACPEETEVSRCCALTSGCDPECLGYGPCDTEDLECLRQACGPELAAQSACLMETGALQTCRLQMDGLAIACFDLEG